MGADAVGGGESDGEVNNADEEVPAAEMIAEEDDPADADAEANNDEEAAAAEGVIAEGVDSVEDETGDEENADERK